MNGNAKPYFVGDDLVCGHGWLVINEWMNVNFANDNFKNIFLKIYHPDFFKNIPNK